MAFCVSRVKSILHSTVPLQTGAFRTIFPQPFLCGMSGHWRVNSFSHSVLYTNQASHKHLNPSHSEVTQKNMHKNAENQILFNSTVLSMSVSG